MSDREILDKIFAKLEQVDNRLGNVESGLVNIESRLGNVESRLGNVENRLGDVEGQLSETNQIVRALMHRTDELDAKYDGLLHTAATRESVDRLEAKIDRILATQATQGESINILALRQLQTEAEVSGLKKAK